MAEDKPDFLHYLKHHPEVRERLFDKVEKEILEEAKRHNYELKPSDLDDLVKEYSKGERVKSAAWSR